MLKESSFRHPVWGKITIRINKRARRIIMRAMHDSILVTVPPVATMENIELALKSAGEKLLRRKESEKEAVITNGYSNCNGIVQLYIEEKGTNGYSAKWDGKRITFYCPEGTDYSSKQQFLRKAIANVTTKVAKGILPQMLQRLAAGYGFGYKSCSVRATQSSWGCCNHKREIRLSTFLVLLPQELINYVILHELCHTIEMNHSDRFWALMDRCTAPEKAKEIRKRLKRYKCGI